MGFPAPPDYPTASPQAVVGALHPYQWGHCRVGPGWGYRCVSQDGWVPCQAPLLIPEPTQCLAKMGARKEGVWGEGVTGSEKRLGRKDWGQRTQREEGRRKGREY